MCIEFLNRKESWRVRWFIALLIVPFGVSSVISAIEPLLN